jgi:hypothetical protein
MKVKQLSLFLENKPGNLSRPVQLLAQARLNILTLCLADTQHFGILRLILRDSDQAKSLLEAQGFIVKETDILVVEVPDKPGGLAEILVAITNAGLNVEYMYGFTVKNESRALLAFRFDDPDAAGKVLAQQGINPIKASQLFEALSQ